MGYNHTSRPDGRGETPSRDQKDPEGDFVRKPFRATPVPVSTYKTPKDIQVGKPSSHQMVEKEKGKTAPELDVPFRAKPVPASTCDPLLRNEFAFIGRTVTVSHFYLVKSAYQCPPVYVQTRPKRITARLNCLVMMAQSVKDCPKFFGDGDSTSST